MAVKARKTLPNDPELAETLAEISYGRKDYRYAIQLLQEKAKSAPLGPHALFYLGMSQWQAKDPLASRDALDRAVAAGLKEPNLSEAQRVLAELKKKK